MKEETKKIYSKSILACSNNSKKKDMKVFSYAVLSNKELYKIEYDCKENSNAVILLRIISKEEYSEVTCLIEDLDLIGPFQFITENADSFFSIYVNYKGVHKVIKSFCGTDEEPGIYNHVFNLLESFANI